MSLPILPVAAFMSEPVRVVFEATDLSEAERRMAEHRVSSLLATDVHGHPLGVVSRFDLLRVGRLRARTSRGPTLLELPRQPVHAVMHRGVVSVPIEATVQDAARLMLDRGIHRVFVMDGRTVKGVLGTRDVMRAVESARIAVAIDRWMSHPVIDVTCTDTIAFAADRLAQARVTGLIVVEDGWPVGLLTQREALEARELPPDLPVDRVMSYALLCLPVGTTVFRAAGHAAATRARRVLVVEKREVRGIVTGLDFARALLDASNETAEARGSDDDRRRDVPDVPGNGAADDE